MVYYPSHWYKQCSAIPLINTNDEEMVTSTDAGEFITLAGHSVPQLKS